MLGRGTSRPTRSNVAASKNLPLGTTAKVTKVQNGRSATVKVEDRGPYAAARVIVSARRLRTNSTSRSRGGAGGGQADNPRLPSARSSS
jgi:rare lipoprotein A